MFYDIWGDEYDYTEVVIVNTRTKILIKHNVCQTKFYQLIGTHKSAKIACNKCSQEETQKRRLQGFKKTTVEEILKRFEEKWGNAFDYSNSNIDGLHKHIEITHKICGTTFTATPYCHLDKKYSCPKCAKMNVSVSRTYTQEDFIEKANLIHNYEYDYSEFVYENSDSKGYITHIICGNKNIQAAHDHIEGSGCVQCADINRKITHTKTFET